MVSVLREVKYAVLLLASAALVGGSVLVAASDNEPYPRILVTGQGAVDVAPDMAVLVLTVTREAETARAALAVVTAELLAVVLADPAR